MASRTVVFYYDVVCPFAYTASKRVEALVQNAGGRVHWTPVLLGGLYKATEAPQGKDGSAMDVMAPAKLNLVTEDLHRQMYRAGITGATPIKHPQKTIHAMRILAGIDDQSTRVTLSKAFFKAYWQDGFNLEEISNLQTVIDQYFRGMDADKMAKDSGNSHQLCLNTEEAAGRGAFGVPSFYMSGRLIWGADRLFMVERLLGKKDAAPERLVTAGKKQGGSAVLTYFFDYSSPWSYLACQQLQRTIESVYPVSVTVEWVPVLLGALFKTIGIPNIPMQAMSVAKQQYYSSDLSYWSQEVAQVNLRWPDNFPLRTVLPLRVTLASGCNPNLIKVLYEAAWANNINIGESGPLKQVLDDNGFDSRRLMEEANTKPIKDSLFTNNERAVRAGACGVPSFQVNHGPLVWGQDRLNVVADLMCGWQYPPSDLATTTNSSKL